MKKNLLFSEAKATFDYQVGTTKSSIVVGATGAARSEDDWKITLALQAAVEIATKENSQVKDIGSISLAAFGTIV